nr:MAG TPA: hypothetical protein [Caudoviricetes sp.]
MQALTEEIRQIMRRHTSGRLASITAVNARPEGAAVTAGYRRYLAGLSDGTHELADAIEAVLKRQESQ